MDVCGQKPFGSSLKEFFRKINKLENVEKQYSIKRIRQSLPSLEGVRSQGCNFLPFINERDGMNRLRGSPGICLNRNEKCESIFEFKRKIKKEELHHSKPSIILSPSKINTLKFKRAKSIPRKRQKKMISIDWMSRKKSSPAIGEYQVKYPEKNCSSYLPKTGRKELPKVIHKEDVSVNAAKIYIEISKSNAPTPNFKAQRERGLLKLTEPRKVGNCHDTFEAAKTAYENMVWLRQMKAKMTYGKILELEDEVEDRIKRVEQSILKKKVIQMDEPLIH